MYEERALDIPIASMKEPFNQIQDICEDYGLFAKIVDYKNNFSVLGSGLYVVLSDEPIDDKVNPYQLYLRNERNPQLVYPKNFAVKLTPENLMVAFDSIMQFCKISEFLRTLSKEFDAALPECIRHSEYVGLQNWNDGRYNLDMSGVYQVNCYKGLELFFSKEKKKNKSFQEKRRFWRSDKYDDSAGKFQQMLDFHNRDSPVVRLNVLMQYTDTVNKLEVPEELKDALIDYLKKCYPEVIIAMDEKKVVDYGLLAFAESMPENLPVIRQKPISSAEFYEIIRKNFATEGFQCIEEYRPARWEYRNIYYKEVDEPQIIAAFNDLCFEFAQADSIFTLKERGDCCMVDLAIGDLYEFVARAKKEKLRFHIDNNGKFAVPSLENIHIIYNQCDEEKMMDILKAMTKQNALQSHLLYEQQLVYAPTLSTQIEEVQDMLFTEPVYVPDPLEEQYEGNREWR